jgi:hypothetical protein
MNRINYKFSDSDIGIDIGRLDMKHKNPKPISHKYNSTNATAPIAPTIHKTIKTKHGTHGKHSTHGKLNKYMNLSSLTLQPTNYISTLVNLYYDNDNVSHNFLKDLNSSQSTKQHIFPEHKRVIVIGDIHGDFDAAIKCLIIAKCIKAIDVPANKSVSTMDNFFKKLEWIGNDTYIVQLGDQIDRVRPQNWDNNKLTIDSAYKDEGSTLEIFYLFYYLDKIARESKGRVFSIIGNHEIMNVEGDFRFVSLKEFKSFKQHLETVYHKNSKYPYHSRTLKKKSYILNSNNNSNNNSSSGSISGRSSRNNNNNNNLPDGYRERLYAFSPTGICSNMMGNNNYTILQIGKWLFCHGSPVLNTLKTYNIDLINNYVSMYLLGVENKQNEISKHYHSITQSGEKSVLWNRDFGETELNKKIEDNLSTQLNTILEAYNNKNKTLQNKINVEKANYIAVGHTIQDTSKHGINSICNGRVWRCDVAMSKAFGNKQNSKYRMPQVLQILNGNNMQILL